MKKTITILLAAIGIMSCGNTPADMRKQLSYLGRVSGRDEDKVAGAGLGALGG